MSTPRLRPGFSISRIGIPASRRRSCSSPSRRSSGEAGYSGGFIEHYLLPVVYPAALTPDVQIVLGALVVVVNVSIYAWILLARPRPQ